MKWCATFFGVGVLALTMFAGCKKAEPPDELTASYTRSFELYPAFAAGVRNSTGLTLYEGLPHPMYERDVAAKEIASKSIVELGEYGFYSEPLSLPESEVAELRALYCDGSTFRAFRGLKMCGGFHADYALVWENGADRIIVQICFSCHEMRTVVGDKWLHCDIQQKAYDQFAAILKKYRKNRPGKWH